MLRYSEQMQFTKMNIRPAYSLALIYFTILAVLGCGHQTPPFVGSYTGTVDVDFVASISGVNSTYVETDLNIEVNDVTQDEGDEDDPEVQFNIMGSTSCGFLGHVQDDDTILIPRDEARCDIQKSDSLYVLDNISGTAERAKDLMTISLAGDFIQTDLEGHILSQGTFSAGLNGEGN